MSSPSKLCLVHKLDLVGLLGHALKEVVRPGDLSEKHDYYRMPDTISILHVLHMLMYVHIIGLMVNLKQFGDIHCPKNYVQKKPQKRNIWVFSSVLVTLIVIDN